ncbi:ATP-dependent Clp protease ATP-binding subunit [Sporosarcina koreensis]|uniref:ATP-dependent Clp protease ATP-binding subunit n=1 Tax=Sporosarcina koreensis TaxID=334735 RepID=UPI00058EA66B|nr:ATP-dependent Clp protease ATP-binding subunit [Sporosarcina koreensis]
MKCQQCGQNQATMSLRLQVNQQSMQMNLCQSCFRQLKGQMAAGSMPSFSANTGGFFQENGGKQSYTQVREPEQQQPGLLDELAHNLSDDTRDGKIDPVIGRDQELKRVIETLNRRNKNNPVLIGEPGVGKTAIAEGLARKIHEGDVPAKLLNKQVYVLDVASLVSNTGIRGQFEERMKELIAELESRDDVLLFVDEIHLLVGAGTAEGSKMDAGNILKPALARGTMQLIGATTLKEYRQIEKDAALERRFQPIIVKEPSAEDTVKILNGIKDRYEGFHEVSYPEDAVKAFVTLSERYIQDRYLPDKAIDLMDEVGARLNLAHEAGDTEALQARLEETVRLKEQAAEQEDYEKAAELRTEEMGLRHKLEAAEEQGETGATVVTVADIERIVEEKTGIPVTKLQAAEQAKMKGLAANLSRQVIGQDEAVEKIAKAIRRSRAGLKSKDRPIGSFLFVGPTGVGKTEITKVLAAELFGTRDAFIRLDMSEYMEKHAVSKLIGSPPGYVGHEEAGQLTEQIRRNPYSIVLLDEIEKAHPDVQNMFLQIMEDGRLTDSHGRTVSFKDTVIIMTSNAGTGMAKKASVGFNKTEHESVAMLDMLGDYFKPEFLNRFDAIVSFSELSEENLLAITDLMLADLQDAIEEHSIDITITDEAKRALVSLGYDKRFGARPLRRVIQDKIEDPLTDLLLEEDDVAAVTVGVENEEITVTKA